MKNTYKALQATAGKRRLPAAVGLLLFAALALLFVGTGPAQAQLGGQFFTLGGKAYAQIVSSNSGFDSFLSLVSPANVPIGGNHDPSWPVVYLGTFPAGTELVFREHMLFNGVNYYTGPASRNPDNVAHAIMTPLGTGAAQFGFEDWWGGGDKDYNDVVFKVWSYPIPEAGTLGLIGAGLVPAAGVLLRRRRVRSG